MDTIGPNTKPYQPLAQYQATDVTLTLPVDYK